MSGLPGGKRWGMPAVSRVGLLLLFVAMLPAVIRKLGELLDPLVPAVMAAAGLAVVWLIVARLRRRWANRR